MVWRFVGLVVFTVLGTAAFLGADWAYKVTRMGSAFTARTVCSGVFITGRDAETVLAEDGRVELTGLLQFFEYRLDKEARLVTASLYGFGERSVRYVEGRGCKLDAPDEGAPEEIAAPAAAKARSLMAAKPEGQPALVSARWPEGKALTPPSETGANPGRLKAALDRAFAEPDPVRLKRTRAVLVVHKGQLIGERYGQGFTAQNPQIGWSMTKVVFGALAGILVRDGVFSPTDTQLLAAWREAGDGRRAITLDHVLRMKTGLAFTEKYNEMLSDVRQMLFLARDMGGYSAAKLLAHAPGKHFAYASGTTNVLSLIMREKLADDARYWALAEEQLFGPLGMTSAVIERDASGTLIGSSYMFATPQDWAKFGQFYLQDGVWAGQRILPEGWVKYQLVPTEGSDGRFGAHMWTALPLSLTRDPNLRDRLPKQTFLMLGHDGQMIAVVPEHDLVVVRLGLTRTTDAIDQAAFLLDVLAAIPKSASVWQPSERPAAGWTAAAQTATSRTTDQAADTVAVQAPVR